MRVLSRVLDFCETADFAETEGHSNWQHAETEHGEYNQESARMEQATAQMRQELEDLQIAMQQQQAVLIQQRSNKSPNIRTGANIHGKICSNVAARADDGDIFDNKAFGQRFKYIGKKDNEYHKVRIFMGTRFGQEIFEAVSWSKRRKKQHVKVVPIFGVARVIFTFILLVTTQVMLIAFQIWNASYQFSLRTSHFSRVVMLSGIKVATSVRMSSSRWQRCKLNAEQPQFEKHWYIVDLQSTDKAAIELTDAVKFEQQFLLTVQADRGRSMDISHLEICRQQSANNTFFRVKNS